MGRSGFGGAGWGSSSLQSLAPARESSGRLSSAMDLVPPRRCRVAGAATSRRDSLCSALGGVEDERRRRCYWNSYVGRWVGPGDYVVFLVCSHCRRQLGPLAAHTKPERPDLVILSTSASRPQVVPTAASQPVEDPCIDPAPPLLLSSRRDRTPSLIISCPISQRLYRRSAGSPPRFLAQTALLLDRRSAKRALLRRAA